jgi:UDP-N-acetylmuramate--alanine ligase
MALNVPGLFNVYNSLATIAVARELDMEYPAIGEGLISFTGVQRRLEVKGKAHGVTVVDDYGHHPTEIRETLKAAKQVWKDKLIVVFQPHRYTRTKALFNEFITAFCHADELIVTDIYAASETPIDGVNSVSLCEGIRSHGHNNVTYMSSFSDIVDRLISIAKPSDIIITQGAGNVWKIGDEFLKKASQV